MTNIQLGLPFYVQGKSSKGNFAKDKIYELIGHTYDQGQLLLFFIDDFGKIAFINSEAATYAKDIQKDTFPIARIEPATSGAIDYQATTGLGYQAAEEAGAIVIKPTRKQALSLKD